MRFPFPFVNETLGFSDTKAAGKTDKILLRMCSELQGNTTHSNVQPWAFL